MFHFYIKLTKRIVFIHKIILFRQVIFYRKNKGRNSVTTSSAICRDFADGMSSNAACCNEQSGTGFQSEQV